MKKIILSALNTRHTHSALALAYLKSYWEIVSERNSLDILEFDLNQTNETIIAELILQQPDILAFSVYIWSLQRTMVVIGAIKAALPDTIIICGGPEVSFNSSSLLQNFPQIDYIIRGEGEVTFTQLLEALLNNTKADNIAGITFRNNNQICENPDRDYIKNLDDIPSPFQNGTHKQIHSFTYYEGSRGCPSRCSYCLSSVLGPVRNHSIERVKSDLDWFFTSGYSQIRFADRTFNHYRTRACELISYIKTHNKKNINFHFEIQADFLTEEIINLLADAPEGMFHLEIGIQSTSQIALKAVNRRFDLTTLRERIKQLKSRTKCHLHLDLLGGLPFDSFTDFCTSLDDVWSLQPHDIQISLVKVLRGTPLEKEMADGKFFAMPDPPYTILRSQWLSCEEAIKIQDIGKLVEGINNCQRFPLSLNFIITQLFAGSAAHFFIALGSFWRKFSLHFYSFSPEVIALRLKEFVVDLNHNLDHMGNINEKLSSLVDHELRLTQKVPCGDAGPAPYFAEPLARHPFRPVQGLRAYWYDFSPLESACPKDSTSPSPWPIAYLFERDASAVPTVQVLELTLAEAFTIAAVQQRIPIESFSKTWLTTYNNLALPDFVETIEKLCESGLLYDPVSKRAKSAKPDKI